MDAKKWKRILKKSMESAGTYRTFFDQTIETAAGVLSARDTAREQWETGGASSTIMNENGRPIKNPQLQIYNDLNATALAYWRDLGLTPKGLKAIDESVMKPRPRSTLSEILRE